MQTMPRYTYNKDWEPFFNRVYDLLVEHAGASDKGDMRLSFVLSFTQVEYPAIEFRFCGNLGMGGKFYRNAGRFYVACYSEGETPERKAIIEKTNRAIEALVEEMRPR